MDGNVFHLNLTNNEHTLAILPKPKENAEYRLAAKLSAILKLLRNKLINGAIMCRK